jgi:hypothetical protein
MPLSVCESVCRRTLGGIRVERPRFAMKLILTADWRSVSLNCPLRKSSFGWTTHLGWQDNGGEMGSTVRLSTKLRVSAGTAKTP